MGKTGPARTHSSVWSRPDRKMGKLVDMVKQVQWALLFRADGKERTPTRGIRYVLKHSANAKRRRHDRGEFDAD